MKGLARAGVGQVCPRWVHCGCQLLWRWLFGWQSFRGSAPAPWVGCEEPRGKNRSSGILPVGEGTEVGEAAGGGEGHREPRSGTWMLNGADGTRKPKPREWTPTSPDGISGGKAVPAPPSLQWGSVPPHFNLREAAVRLWGVNLSYPLHWWKDAPTLISPHKAP